MNGKTAAAVVKQAQAWIGCKESDGSHKAIIDTYNAGKPAGYYTMTYTDAWCACFVSAVAMKCGCTDIIPVEVGCERMIQRFKGLGSWVEDDGYVPEPGDIIFYDWQDSGSGDNTGFSDHVGIVEKVERNNITVIEGNYSDSVGRRVLAVDGKYIRGYGVPQYVGSKAAASSGTAAASSSAGKKSVEEVAKEVRQGLWGNGAERMAKLEAAGYDYAEVQKTVNALVSNGSNQTTASTAKDEKSLENAARAVIRGEYGNGLGRMMALKAAGFDYNAVQAKVNELLKS